MNLYSLFLEHFPEKANAIFLEDVDGQNLTYAELHRRSGQMLNLLQKKGVYKGCRVVVQVEKSIDAVVLYLACLRAGAVYIPLNTAYTSAELAYFLGDASPQLFVCTPARRKELKRIAEKHGVAEILTLGMTAEGELMDALACIPESDEIVDVAEDDLAAILYTSGTTGRSKGAMLSHNNLAANAQVLFDYWHWQDDDVLLHALPIFHVHGLFVALHCVLLGGSKVIFMPRFDVDTVIEKLPESTVMMGIPTFYTRLLERDNFTAEVCRGMRLFISGSAPLLAETHREFELRSGHKILERYGMTETGMITSNPYDGERIEGTVGFPLPGISVRVADDEGRELTHGEVGVLETTGPNVFSGYWQLPEKTAEEFRPDGWFITGDIAQIDEQNRVTIIGRAKDVIISGGFNVYPKEVEAEIDDLAGVMESAVVAVPHSDFGEAVVAVVIADGSIEITQQSILDALRDRLAKFKQPKKILILDRLPRNSMGKVQKNILRDTYRELFR